MNAPRQSPAMAPRPVRGFALVPALFLVVVLGALALVAIRVGNGQQHAVTMGLLQARAMAAARTGVEWGAYRALAPAPNVPLCAASTTLNLTEAALNAFAVTVNCVVTAYANGAATSHSYTITSTAISGLYGKPDYVRRVFSSTFTDAP